MSPEAAIQTVLDDETLYRSVPIGQNLYRTDPDGRWRLSSQAFNDRTREPSVDRATLCGDDPTRSQFRSTDGVVKVYAKEVRSISGISGSGGGAARRTVTYDIDVVPAPLAENPAHAVIKPSPAYKSGSVFKRVLEALAGHATKHGWVIPPGNTSFVPGEERIS